MRFERAMGEINRDVFERVNRGVSLTEAAVDVLCGDDGGWLLAVGCRLLVWRGIDPGTHEEWSPRSRYSRIPFLAGGLLPDG